MQFRVRNHLIDFFSFRNSSFKLDDVLPYKDNGSIPNRDVRMIGKTCFASSVVFRDFRHVFYLEYLLSQLPLILIHSTCNVSYRRKSCLAICRGPRVQLHFLVTTSSSE